jgi:dihydropteroate synthase
MDQNSGWSNRPFAWGERTLVMAIINATPDSFSGDGIDDNVYAAMSLALIAEQSGADVIDIGAESTRPRHIPIDATTEVARLLPVLHAVRERTSLPISVDTSKAEVAEAALDAGASIVNDIRGFTADPELAQVVARRNAPAVVMHDVSPDGYGDLVTSIVRELSRRLDRAVVAGVGWDKLVIDPGFGFGKDWRQNLELLRRLDELSVLGRPILVGFSRKSTIGRVLGVAEHDRLEGTLATTALAIANGADVVRVHDVEANVRVARMSDAVIRGAPEVAKTWPGA